MRAGEYGEGRVPVVSHAMDIPDRLRELDEGYFVMLNTRTQRFEVWHRGEGQGVLECVLPYDGLDERTIRHVREHRIERMDKLIREIEAHNRRIEETARQKWLDEAGERTREAFRYLKNKATKEEIPEELMRR